MADFDNEPNPGNGEFESKVLYREVTLVSKYKFVRNVMPITSKSKFEDLVGQNVILGAGQLQSMILRLPIQKMKMYVKNKVQINEI